MLYEQTGRGNVSLVSLLDFRMGGFILYQPLCFIESVLQCGCSAVEVRQWGIVESASFLSFF